MPKSADTSENKRKPAPRKQGRGCKTCKSDRLDWVNTQIKTNRSDKWISQNLATMGIKIAASSIGRHRMNCLGIKFSPDGDNPPPPSDSDDIVASTIGIPVQAIVSEVRKRAGADCRVAVSMLGEITENQLAIVLAKQRMYIQGQDAPPTDDVAILRTVQGMLREEAVITNLEIDGDMPVDEKANRIAQGVVDGKVSPANGERLIGVLHKQLELVEYKRLVDQVESLKREVIDQT